MSRCIIFDLDGTLVDSVLVCVDILNNMLQDRGADIRVSEEAAAVQVSRGGREMCAALLGDWCEDPDAEIAEFRRRYSLIDTPARSLYPGARETLEDARAKGLRLAICSNKPQNLCEKVLADLGLAHLFDAVVGGQGGQRPKPELDLVRLCIQRLGAKPADCLFVGDSELDHIVANAMGMPFIHLSHGYGKCVPGLPALASEASLGTAAALLREWAIGNFLRAAA